MAEWDGLWYRALVQDIKDEAIKVFRYGSVFFFLWSNYPFFDSFTSSEQWQMVKIRIWYRVVHNG